ncbi:hypothetical protein HU200_013400 [Digitaria exilis]|uniref:Peroxidase n=1 Tax=Digitaria exilis TaxID=1010633 RepID=A0A835FDU5_9POAL|nr:hypothetical protein HU200_013400 [Digitaria exilis]
MATLTRSTDGLPRSRRRRPRRPRRRGGRAEAVGQLLLQDVPEPGHHRAAGDGVRRPEGEAHGRLHPPHVLPRLLRQRMRRLHPAGRHGHLHRREERRAQRQVCARVRGDRRHQTQVEASCKATVSCADIVALAARDGVNLLGGPTWSVPLGRKDSRTASQSLANTNLPGPGSSLATLISKFGNQGLSARDMTALSGAHTIGRSQCQFSGAASTRSPTSTHLRGAPAGDVPEVRRRRQPRAVRRADARRVRQRLLPEPGGAEGAAALGPGALQWRVAGRAGRQYSTNPAQFSSDFVTAMIKMGNLLPSSGPRRRSGSTAGRSTN